MLETVYLHIETKTKTGRWSVNLPFLCTKCGVCCKLDDFLTAGPIKATEEEQPQIHAKLKLLYEDLAVLLEKGEEEYDRYVMHTPCPFLDGKLCSIYLIRPEGCRRFPDTPFAMLSQDCEALTRFKKQRSALKRGRKVKEVFCSTTEPTRAAELSDKQYQNCVSKLRRAGVTGDELMLFEDLNRIQKRK
ncbi:MAG: YkgJ family cysteine cluster protein [Candidatus Bathyarchaeota archaeon]|nr:YkgJ family cysteine cluster protein [Candidatus Bathyarchaeota archaeon]